MQRQEYPAMLPQLPPQQAVDILNDRVRQVGKLNGAIAEWIQDRRKLEEQYSAGLRRLAQRQMDGVDLGVFSTPWSALTDSADQLADSHSAFAVKVEQDVEIPLRDFEKNSREAQAMSTIQGNLSSMAKDVETQQQKTEKLQGKGEKVDSSKMASAQSNLEGAQQQWETQAPYVFETLQSLDESRLNNLRDVLVQLQTHESDLNEQSRKATEHSVNVLLNVEVSDEIQTFILKALQQRPSEQRKRPSFATPSRDGTSAPTASSLAPPAIPSQDEEASSMQDDKRKSRFGGLKRLGTVMGRRRESKMPANIPARIESPEQKPKTSPFAIGGKRGKAKDAPSLEPPMETQSYGRPSSPLRAGSEIFQESQESPAGPVTPSAAAQRRETLSQLNGSSPAPVSIAAVNGHQSDLADLEPPQSSQTNEAARSEAETARENTGFSMPPQNLDPISQAQQDAAMAGESGTPQFNVNIRNEPIREEGANSEAALASVANKLQAPPTTTRRAGTVRGRRQDRSSFINTGSIPSQTPTSGATPEPVKEALESIPQEERAAPDAATLAEASSTLSSPEAFAPGQSTSSAFSPFAPQIDRNSPSPFAPDSRGPSRSDNHSIHSATTTGSQGGHKHPDPIFNGLNASIIESVSARFESGNLTSCTVTGEIALAHTPTDGTGSQPTSTTLRLDDAAICTKLVPNPAFLSPVPNKDSEYALALSTLTSKPQVAFKYQATPTQGANSSAPLVLSPASRVEPSQISVIVSYSLNPDFRLPAGQTQLTLKNLTLALHVEGARASSCQSKPVGTFLRERNAILWQLGDVTLSRDAAGAPSKVLARFATDGEARAGGLEAKWAIVADAGQEEHVGSGVAVSMMSGGGAGPTEADPFADEEGNGGEWKAVRGAKKVVSGNYVAK